MIDIESLESMSDFKIVKSSYYVPDNIVTNDDLAKTIDTNDEWVYKRTGIKTRHIATESLQQMVKNAIINLRLTQSEAQDIDLIIIASSSNEIIMPSLSAYVQSIINCNKQVMCIDLNAACTGFVHSLIVAEQFFKAKTAKKALVIGAEKMSNIIDATDRNTAILFGDGVGAFYLESDYNHILASTYETSYGEAIIATNNGMQMQGQQVFKYAVKTVISSINKLLDQSKLEITDIDYIICHQANQRILNTIIREYGLDQEQVLSTIKWSANTSSASIPIVFNYHVNKINPGNKIMFIGFGAGLTSSAMLYKE